MMGGVCRDGSSDRSRRITGESVVAVDLGGSGITTTSSPFSENYL